MYIYIAHAKIIIYTYAGFRKKLQAVAKQKDCELIGKWERSIINHLYWCVASTPDGNWETTIAKWLSLENHVHNVHSGHSHLFPKCSHEDLDGQDRRKKWFKTRKFFMLCLIDLSINFVCVSDTKPSEKLSQLLTNTSLCKDLTRVSPSFQTSSLESFHSVVLHFAPKSTAFSYHGMQSR